MNHKNRLGLGLITVASVMSSPISASADEHTGFRAEMFDPQPVQHTAVLNLRRPMVLKHLSVGGGLFAHFVENPVRTADVPTADLTGTVVDRALTSEVGLGLGLFDVLQLSIAAPVVSAQWGRNMPDAEEGGFPFGDTRAGLDLLVVDPERANGFGVSVGAMFRLPTGESSELTSDDALRFEPALALGKRFKGGHELLVNAGLSVGDTRSVPRFAYSDAGSLLGGVGGILNLGGSQFDLIGSVYGRYSVVDDLLDEDGTGRQENQARAFEGLGGVRWRLPFNAIAQLGGGARLNDGLPAPDLRVFTSFHWAWEWPEPEPEPVEATPEPEPEPEPVVEPEPEPEPEPVVEPEPEPEPEPAAPKVVAHKIEFSESIQFETGSAVIREESFELLRQIAGVVKRYPQITKVQVEGHTDSVGNDAANKRLSTARAKAVRDFIIKEGIEASRLVAAGFGEEKPIASNDTDEGRSRNRRVEFLILDVNGQPVKEGQAIIEEEVPAE